MDKFDYHQYACNMREHLSPKDLVVPETYEINHRYFNAKCNEYWSPEDQENLKEGIKLYETDYETINVKFFKSKVIFNSFRNSQSNYRSEPSY